MGPADVADDEVLATVAAVVNVDRVPVGPAGVWGRGRRQRGRNVG